MNKSLVIKSAFYNAKNVTSIVKNLIFGEGSLFFIASNGVFGDPEPYKEKTLKIRYTCNGKNEELEVKENNYVKINYSPSDRLGIWYTNNCSTKPLIIKKSLDELAKISNKKVTILTSVWEEINNNPYKSYKSFFNHGGLININLQILQLLYAAKKIHDFKYVSFLEHDVLYPIGYFDYPDFDKGSIMTNMNYIQLSKKGWQKNNNSDQPLHEMTMHFSDAIDNFESNLQKGLRHEYFLLENQNLKRKSWKSKNPSVHVYHGAHLTSHYDIYSNEYEQENYYWGNVALYSDILKITH